LIALNPVSARADPRDFGELLTAQFTLHFYVASPHLQVRPSSSVLSSRTMQRLPREM
jgi:hypothetical protein